MGNVGNTLGSKGVEECLHLFKLLSWSTRAIDFYVEEIRRGRRENRWLSKDFLVKLKHKRELYMWWKQGHEN